MKTKSSPGPWYLRHAFGKYELSYDDDMIADMKMSGLPEDADNARLIAAAPELLDAARFARGIAMTMSAKADIPYCAEFAAIAQELDAAIAKATGASA